MCFGTDASELFDTIPPPMTLRQETHEMLTAEDVRDMFDRFAENIILRLDRREQHFQTAIRVEQERMLAEYVKWSAKLEDAGKWIDELRKRSHDQANDITKIYGDVSDLKDELDLLQERVGIMRADVDRIAVQLNPAVAEMLEKTDG